MSQDSKSKSPIFAGTRFKTYTIAAVVVVSIFSLVMFLYLQELARDKIRAGVLEQHKLAQIEATRRMAEHIGTDVSLIVNTIEGLTNSYYLQRGDLSSENSKKFIEEKFNELSPKVSSLFILDKNNIVAVSLAPQLSETLLSSDFSQRQWVIETRESRMPMYSAGFERQGIYRLFISYPIINMESQEILGIIAVSIPSVPYFSYYANVHDINSQFLVALNKDGTILAIGADQDLVGDSFFGEEAQNFINHSPVLNEMVRDLLAGNAGSDLYDYGSGERLTTQNPVYVRGQPLFFIQLVSPTEEIYAGVDSSLQSETANLFLIFSGTVISIGILSLLLLRWNAALGAAVGERTRQLADAYGRLELNLQAQKEFLEVAAHELRTPVQPILGLAQSLHAATKSTTMPSENYEGQLLEVIVRNAQRLKSLTENLLDISRIDSGALRLNIEKFDLFQLAASTALEMNSSHSAIGNISVVFKASDSVFVNADKDRLTQVITNLLLNSQKFAKHSIEVSVAKSGNEALFTVRDDGSGIAPEILPRLFVKFISRSDGGTGLGLYISKGIIEAHGGKIGAENNIDGVGASFHFSLPIASSE
jgi:signal transduction histidine kinase